MTVSINPLPPTSRKHIVYLTEAFISVFVTFFETTLPSLLTYDIFALVPILCFIAVFLFID